MFRKILALLVMVGALVAFQAPPALALTGDNGQVVVDDTLHQVQTLSLLIGTVLPIAVAFFTKANIHPGKRAVILAALSAVSGLATEYAASIGQGTFDLYAALLTALTTFVVAVATHFGLWAPTGVADRAARNGVK